MIYIYNRISYIGTIQVHEYSTNDLKITLLSKQQFDQHGQELFRIGPIAA